MVIGFRRSPTMLLSPQQQLQAYVSYDPVSRRAVRFIETIVPTLASDANIPADIYYGYPGAGLSPSWISASGTTLQWDATNERFYTLLSNAGSIGVVGTKRVAWPTGVTGDAGSFSPKNGEVAICVLEFMAQFNDNSDWTVRGVGLHSSPGTGSSPTDFSSTSNHFIQVLRNSGNWELGSCDGSTITQSSAAGGDGNPHDFRVEWEDGTVRLYVDDTLTITKTTNLPAQPLAFDAMANGTTRTLHLYDFKIYWKAAA